MDNKAEHRELKHIWKVVRPVVESSSPNSTTAHGLSIIASCPEFP